MARGRQETTTGTLARQGFGDAGRARELLDSTGLADHPSILADLTAAADPDLALLGLTRLLESVAAPGELLAALDGESDLRARLTRVLGASRALGDHLTRHPEDWRELRGHDAARQPGAGEYRAGLLHAVGADPSGASVPVADLAGHPTARVATALHAAYRRRVLHLAARDLTGITELDDIAAELAGLAAAVLEGALALARAEDPAAARLCRLAVVGMGKCGAGELNYVSDVDVVFVAEPATADAGEQEALRAATRLATSMMRVISEPGSEGTLWEVDAALRPEGKNGPLVRTLASHVSYYERWAKTWEFQALLKARPIAGDADLGEQYLAQIAPMVWQAADRPNFVDDVQAMRRRVEAHIAPSEAERQLKLGRGGLRDIEFAVQLLQLVHGRSDDSVRSPATLTALAELSAGGYVGRADAGELAESYRFLRRLEHLVQLYRLRRTHLLPDPNTDEGRRDLRRMGRALGLRGDPAAELLAAWRRHTAEVRRLHEKLFYRPLLNAVARLPESEARLSPEQARSRLEALGFLDPAGALRHLEALTQGVSRSAAIRRTLLPVMLGWFADCPDPDAGLLGFRQVSEALDNTPWYLRLLRDDVRVAERMARLLGTSKYATELLLRAPDAVAMLADERDLAPRHRAELRTEAAAILHRHASAEGAVTALRSLRRRELLRTATADLLGLNDVTTVGTALTEITAVTVDAALRAAIAEVARTRDAPPPVRFCVVAMGRFGGGELSYASDADVLFVYTARAGTDAETAAASARAIAAELRRLLELPAADPPLVIDTALRPEGRNGPEVRTLSSYANYYTRWSALWESQALLRAWPVAGDSDLGAEFTNLIDPLRYPEDGVSESGIREIRKLKARMEAERLPRGADPALHTKLGPGGLSDVEWVVQLLQLRHAHRCPELRTTGTLRALEAARDAGLVEDEDADTLAAAWRLASRIRDAVTLVRGKAGDSIPTDVRARAALAQALGYLPAEDEGSASEQLLEDYRQHTRRARAVMERLFYDS
ncbi:bifunctional [glutamine synthetase] adenylyltransferase/[glutamine synthetase]-adenylyl-L-tyrosine phosphorylase [Lipingzhangella rawalii]|uniref:bifunctional [glutamine synthetase] adenylyltransferase/[glutamine synthetase]-adenylyl-L-tyrosine phosphorylase n=1 Tax=Lipingzhangella rawalii TaxID=2055835 RepID=UPI0038992002